MENLELGRILLTNDILGRSKHTRKKYYMEKIKQADNY